MGLQTTGPRTTGLQTTASSLAGWIVPAAQVRWLGPGVAYYTPQRVEQIFRQALAGDLMSQWECFDLMEATWPKLATNLNELKDDVAAIGFVVEPWKRKGEEATPEAIRRAELVEELLWTMKPRADSDENELTDTLKDLLDARGKGISILEIDWESRVTADGGAAMAPRCTRWVHPIWYGYPHGPGDANLRLRAATQAGGPKHLSWPGDTTAGYGYNWGYAQDWVEFPEHKFLIGVAKNKTGHPLGGAMLWVLSFWWAASNFTAEWFLNFCQVYGQPLRWATYSPNMTPDDQVKLKSMLINMGASAWGMFPDGTNFNLEESSKGGNDTVQKVLMDHADYLCDLVVKRQTLTSDVGAAGSKAAAEVHERVLGSAEAACARWVCKVMQQLIDSICALNFGDLSECPALTLPSDDEAAPKEIADTLQTLSQAGMEPTDEELPSLGEKIGFAIQRKAVPEPLGEGEGSPHPGPLPARGSRGEGGGASADGQKSEVAGKEMRPAKSVPTDPIAAARAEVMGKAYRGSMAPFRQILLESNSRDECLTKLARAYADWSPERLASEMEAGLQICAAAGARRNEG